jgi:hypothetical protein
MLLRRLSIPSSLHLLMPALFPDPFLPFPPLPQFLENVLHAPPALAELRTVDEAVVIGAALSLSSSAFVLQLLRERGELDSRVGQATLGILLLQDIATVPFLVLLPLIEGNNSGEPMSMVGWRAGCGGRAGGRLGLPQLRHCSCPPVLSLQQLLLPAA